MVFDPGLSLLGDLLFFRTVCRKKRRRKKRWKVDIINIHHSSCWWSKDKKKRRSCRVTLDLKETEKRMMKNPPPSQPSSFSLQAPPGTRMEKGERWPKDDMK
jgi:hypothetical protein